MEENTYRIRKDKVKNIAIIFLSVMLVLTFFSNSILNHSLPEVATQYVRYDTITEKVRGSGTVTADDPYKVVIKDSRTIESVAVKAGDTVTKDQVLFYLEDSDSEELKKKEEEVKAKEDELSKQVLEYMTSILSVDISNEAYQHIQSDNIATVAAYQAKIEAVRQKVKSAQDTVDSLNRQILVAGMSSEDDVDRDTELAIATANRDNASKRMTEAQAKITEAEGTISTLDKKAADAGNALEVTALNANNDYNTKKTDYDAKKDSLVGELEHLNTDPATPIFIAIDYFDSSTGIVKDLNALTELQALAVRRDSEIGSGTATKDSFDAMKDEYNDLLTAKTKMDAANKDVSDYNAAKSALSSAKTALTNATNEYNSYQAKVESLTNKKSESSGDNTELQNSLKISLADAEAVLKAAQKEQDQLLKDVSNELALSSKNDEIADTEKELSKLNEELEELKEESTGATIDAPVEGTVISISKTAGETTTANEEIALIQVAGKGMSLSFSVTNDQAAKVKVGDPAQLQNSWYYEDVKVTLSKIKPDTEDPGKKKLLEFNVEGSVQSGETLALSIGERSAEYEHVVPNSAVREDKNGKFILIIEEKTTPFGNRYKAKRVNVEVIASDETKTAIQAELQGYEYVITTSNKPVETGDQVRLAEY